MTNPKGDAALTRTPDYVRFGFKRGNPSVLTITFPRQQTALKSIATPAGPAANRKMSSQDVAMITRFYTDMKITMDVLVNGTVVGSNASFRDGNRVTLVDFQFNRLLKNPDFMKQLKKGQGDRMSNFQNLGEMFPGMKIETKPEIEVRFRK
jgi:hypothetical protein